MNHSFFAGAVATLLSSSELPKISFRCSTGLTVPV